MKTNVLKLTVLLMIFAGSFSSCKNNGDLHEQNDKIGQSTTDELIISNLSKDGLIDPELLIGEWDMIKFAFTPDGVEITNEEAIAKGYLFIPSAPTPKDSKCNDLDNLWMVTPTNYSWYIGSIFDNLIKFTHCSSTYAYIIPPNERYGIGYAIDNAYSFVIRGNELIIYFKQAVSFDYWAVIENKNLLILKKR